MGCTASAEADNVSPFDSNIACLGQSIEINNNKYNKTKLNKTICIFYGMYCVCSNGTWGHNDPYYWLGARLMPVLSLKYSWFINKNYFTWSVCGLVTWVFGECTAFCGCVKCMSLSKYKRFLGFGPIHGPASTCSAMSVGPSSHRKRISVNIIWRKLSSCINFKFSS